MTETESSENDPAREQPAARPAALGFFSMRKKILNPAFPAPILLIPKHDHLVVLSLYLSLRFFTRDNPNELLQASFHAKSFHNGTDTRKQYVFHKTCTDLAKLLLPPFIVQNKRTILSTNKSKDLHYTPQNIPPPENRKNPCQQNVPQKKRNTPRHKPEIVFRSGKTLGD